MKVIEWNTDGSDEMTLCYRLDDHEAAKAFFRHLLDNAEIDGREKFNIKEITPQEWSEIEKRGDDFA